MRVWHACFESEIAKLCAIRLHCSLLLIDFPSVFQRSTSILLYIISVTSRLRNSPAEQNGDQGWYCSNTDHNTPENVNANFGVVNLVRVCRENPYL